MIDDPRCKSIAAYIIAVSAATIAVNVSSMASSLRRIAAQWPVKVEVPIQRVEAKGLPAMNGMGMKR